MFLKIAIFLSCGILKYLGELYQHNYQRWVLPGVLGLGVGFVTGIWWLGILTYPCCIFIDLAYRDYGPSDGFDHGAWLFIILVSAGLAVTIARHDLWWAYCIWCVLGGVWGATTRQLNNKIIAPITGLLIGTLIWLVH